MIRRRDSAPVIDLWRDIIDNPEESGGQGTADLWQAQLGREREYLRFHVRRKFNETHKPEILLSTCWRDCVKAAIRYNG